MTPIMFRGYPNPDDISVKGKALYRVYKGQHLVWRKYGFIECEFDTYFDEYVAESFGVLSVGNLVIDFVDSDGEDGEFGGLEAYVIDWYLDGGLQFSTGYGLDGQEYYAYSHPFNEVGTALNVQSGTWTPRVRFVDVDGVRYMATNAVYAVEKDWCQLPDIVVKGMMCDEPVNPVAHYSHTVSFNGMIHDESLGTQTVDFKLNEDGSTRYMAFRFTAYDEQDRLKVYYVSGESQALMWDGIVGKSDSIINASTLFAFPYKVGRPHDPVYFILDFSDIEYSLGDFLRINIEGASQTGNVGDTAWVLNMNCLNDDGETPYDLGCPTKNTALVLSAEEPKILVPTVSGITMTWNGSSCRWELRGTVSNNVTVGDNYMIYTRGTIATNYRSTSLAINFNFNKQVSNSITNFTGKECVAFEDYMTFTKVGNVFTLQFPNEDFYNEYKNDLLAADLSPSADSSLIEHYKFVQIYGFREQDSCFDTGWTARSFLFWAGSDFALDDTNFKITITAASISDGMTFEECEFDSTSRTNNIALVTQTLALDDFEYQTKTVHYSAGRAFRRVYHVWTILNQTSVGANVIFQTYLWTHGSVVCESDWWCKFSYYYNMYAWVVTGIITDEEDPENNFEIWSRTDHEEYYDPQICIRTAALRLIYKVESVDEDSDEDYSDEDS